VRGCRQGRGPTKKNKAVGNNRQKNVLKHEGGKLTADRGRPFPGEIVENFHRGGGQDIKIANF